ncbi:MAG: hypothetical protein JWQ63_881, partial [Mucilaginibacter sp.]|nr:hypothetical protein [Mucilaginibacter sp.]
MNALLKKLPAIFLTLCILSLAACKQPS